MNLKFNAIPVGGTALISPYVDELYMIKLKNLSG